MNIFVFKMRRKLFVTPGKLLLKSFSEECMVIQFFTAFMGLSERQAIAGGRVAPIRFNNINFRHFSSF